MVKSRKNFSSCPQYFFKTAMDAKIINVIPAQVGIQNIFAIGKNLLSIPACAGMTKR
jgi:hypothetical protein